MTRRPDGFQRSVVPESLNSTGACAYNPSRYPSWATNRPRACEWHVSRYTNRVLDSLGMNQCGFVLSVKRKMADTLLAREEWTTDYILQSAP